MTPQDVYKKEGAFASPFPCLGLADFQSHYGCLKETKQATSYYERPEPCE